MNTNWDIQWKTESEKSFWNTPNKNVVKFSEENNIGEGDAVLDLGCGIGRHAIYFAQRNAYVSAVDESPIAIEAVRKLNLNIKTELCDYLKFNPPEKFDYIIAFNVIYHGDFSRFSKSINKCCELLKPNGKIFFTCPSRSDAKYGNGKKITEHTYESLNSVHPGDIHYFTCETEIKDLMVNFKNIKIEKEEYYWDNSGTKQFASNFIIIAERFDKNEKC